MTCCNVVFHSISEITYPYQVPVSCENTPKPVIKCVSELDFEAEINLEITSKRKTKEI